MTVRERGILALLPSPCRKALMQGHGSPSFLWKEVPRRGGGWLSQRNKKEWGRSIFPYRHPERSRGIFVALPPYAHMRPHSNDTLVLPFSPFPHPRFTGLQEGSLHSGRDDVYGKRVVSHSFSHRYVDPSCAFGAGRLASQEGALMGRLGASLD